MTGILILLLGLSLAAAGNERDDKPATPAEQYQALLKEFQQAARGLYTATSDEDRKQSAALVFNLSPRTLELAEKHRTEPFALDALVQVVVQELWLQNNTTHPGRGKDNLEGRAIAILLRDHVRSDQLGDATRRMSYGFSKECENFLRTVLKMSPHRDIQALACLRLGQLLNLRLQRLDLLKERPEMASRYEGMFGKDYLASLRRRNRATSVKEVEAFFERATAEYGDVKVPYGGTVREKAESELHEIRYLSVGKEAQDIDGEDQDGKRFNLSDYRGKVVLLYFWSEY